MSQTSYATADERVEELQRAEKKKDGYRVEQSTSSAAVDAVHGDKQALIQKESLSNLATQNVEIVDVCAREREAQRMRMRYTYQASEMKMCFIHPMNARMIVRECGGLEEAAVKSEFMTLRGQMLEIENHTMDTNIRRRYKFLSHLPDGCEFAFVGLDLSSVLAESTLQHFASELRRRQATRRHKKHVTARESRRVQKRQDNLLRKHLREQSPS